MDITGPITIKDDKTAQISINIPPKNVLVPGATVTGKSTYKVTQADLNAGSVMNTATATGTCNNKLITSPLATATVNADQSLALTLVKTAFSPTYPYTHTGEVIQYSYTVTNSGHVDITGPITIKDDKADSIIVNQPLNNVLGPGASVTGTSNYMITQADLDAGYVVNTAIASGFIGKSTYKVTQADLNAGSVVNTAIASGLFITNPISSNTATATVTAAEKHPALNITKVASPSSYDHVGELITYTYTVNNIGNMDFKVMLLFMITRYLVEKL